MNIIDYLNSKKKTPEEVYPKLHEGIMFLDSFFNDFKDPLRIIGKSSVRELCLAYFTCISAKNYSGFIILLDKYKDLFCDNSVDILVILIILCTNEDFISLVKKGKVNDVELKKYALAISTTYNISKQACNEFIFFNNIKDIENFIIIFEKIGFRFHYALELIGILYTYDDIRKTRDNFGDKENFDEEILEAEKEIGNIHECCDYFKVVYNRSKIKYAEAVRVVNRYNNTLQKIIDILSKNSNYIKPDVMDSILSLEVDDEIKHTILDYIYSVNSKIESKIIKSYNDFVIGTKKALKDILDDYGIIIYDLSSKEVNSLCKMRSLFLRGILEFFFKFQIPLPNILSIASYDLNTIERITSFLQNGILTTSFIARNLNILAKDNPGYKILVTNLDGLTSRDINIKNYPNNLDILLNDLSYALSLLEKYGININNRTKDISFLDDAMLEAKLDLLIEFGNDIMAMPNYDELNDSYEVLFFKLLSSSLGFEYNSDTFTVFNASDLMPNSNSLVPDDLATKFISNMAYGPLPEVVKDYLINQNTLYFNGVYLSAHRICKNMSVIDINDKEQIFYAIIYQGHFNLKQINLIKEELEKALNRA